MQQTQLAVLDMGDSLPIYNGHREERRRERGCRYYKGEIACTSIMQQTQLAVLDMGDSLPIYNGHLGRGREERVRL